MTKISIIVPSFNQGKFLEDTFQSILSQNYANTEIIVMDGGSTDNSINIIKKYESHISYWQSQKDNGQSDAINQGFAKATGDIVTWLNSDDVLLPGTLNKVNEYAIRYPSTQWFLGNVLWMDKEGDIIRIGKVEKESVFWNRLHLFSNGGPTAFMRKQKLLEMGGLREDFHYMMDTELWHRYISNAVFFKRIPIYCWGLRIHEDAKMSGHNFANSQLADKSHPSWTQKEREKRFIQTTYLTSRTIIGNLWKYKRAIGVVILSKLLDRKLLGNNYKDL
ncbi:MAG: glycosyltransferase [Bacteroidales bacterium]|nr:glycosyltransferase [Candidatus Physcousia equi]